jgi:hypothetical protein
MDVHSIVLQSMEFHEISHTYHDLCRSGIDRDYAANCGFRSGTFSLSRGVPLLQAISFGQPHSITTSNSHSWFVLLISFGSTQVNFLPGFEGSFDEGRDSVTFHS